MISAATAAVAVVVAPLVIEHGVDYLFAATVLMGVIQVLAGFLRLDLLMQYVSRSVVTGFVNALAILIFISTWNEYFWPLLLSRTAENSVVQIGIQMFMTSEGNAWGPLMAASTMASLPILIIYIVLQRQVVQSFMKSGIR